MIRAQAVADVGDTLHKVDVLLDEVFVHRVVLNNVVADEVEDRQIGLWFEQEFCVGDFTRAICKGRQHMHPDVLGREAAVGDARPQDRVHLRHVRAPQHEGVGVLGIVVAAHRLVDAEGAHEASHSRGHAMTRVWIDVVGTETGLEQLYRRVALPDGPLTRAKHADRSRPLRLQRRLALLFHNVEGLFPADRREFTVLGELAILHT